MSKVECYNCTWSTLDKTEQESEVYVPVEKGIFKGKQFSRCLVNELVIHN